VLLLALLAAAVAAASVSAATSSQKAATHGGITARPGQYKDAHGNSVITKHVGTAAFTPTARTKPQFVNTKSANQREKASASANRLIPGKLGPKGFAGAKSAAPAAAAAGAAASSPGVLTPHAHSLPIQNQASKASAKGLNAYDQASVGGYILTPPDQALAEGNGFVLEAVNNVFQVMDTNFGHVSNAESMESFFAPAILTTGFDCLSDPKAHYDTATRKWYVTEVAYGLVCASGLPGSAVFIGVSTTSDPLGTWNIYVLDTSFDGTTCGPDGCLADQPLMGMNRNALFISTNSYDWDSPAFNGTQMYIIDSTALASGSLFPTIVYADIGGLLPTPEGLDGCGTGVFPDNAYCWYSVQPATTPNMNFVSDHNGTEFGLSALDFLGGGDNRVALWAVTGTNTISFVSPVIGISWATSSTEAYKFPLTDNCVVDEFGTTCGYAQQPPSGNTPECDFLFGPFCAPGPIANNDDRMNEVKSVKYGTAAAHNWGGVNTAILVPDPLGTLHRRSGIAYFDLQATGFVQALPGVWFLTGAHTAGQGYVANWQNDVLFPAIGVSSVPNHGGQIVYTLTGNNNFPSVAISHVTDSAPASKIGRVLAGQDVLDDFGWYFFQDPRWGDYSAAVGDGTTIYLASEYIQSASCDDSTFLFDPTCGGTRAQDTNWGTGLVKVNV
jgi:hypothetical protein